MALTDLRRLAGSWLQDLALVVWPEGQVEPLQDQAERLKARIRRGYDDLLRQRRFLEGLQQLVEEQEHRAAALPWQVEGRLQVGNKAAAWRLALELDDVRFSLEQDQRRLGESRQAYEQQAAYLARERQRLGVLQVQILQLQARLAERAPA